MASKKSAQIRPIRVICVLIRVEKAGDINFVATVSKRTLCDEYCWHADDAGLSGFSQILWNPSAKINRICVIRVLQIGFGFKFRSLGHADDADFSDYRRFYGIQLRKSIESALSAALIRVEKAGDINFVATVTKKDEICLLCALARHVLAIAIIYKDAYIARKARFIARKGRFVGRKGRFFAHQAAVDFAPVPG